MATIKQKTAVPKMIENIRKGNKKTEGQILKESGYSDSISKAPSRVTKSKGWNELMELYLPDDLIAKQHNKLITAQNKIRITKKGELVTEYEEPNTDAIARGVDMAYKLKAKYKPIIIEHRSFVGWTPQELEEYASSGTIPERFITEG